MRLTLDLTIRFFIDNNSHFIELMRTQARYTMQKNPADLPFKVGYVGMSPYATICKECQKPMEPNEMRLAVMSKTPMTGLTGYKAPSWHHLKCFFDNHQPTSVDQFECFNLLNGTDKARIQREIDHGTASTSAASTSSVTSTSMASTSTAPTSAVTNVNGLMMNGHVSSSTSRHLVYKPHVVLPLAKNAAPINVMIKSAVSASAFTSASSTSTLPKTTAQTPFPTVCAVPVCGIVNGFVTNPGSSTSVHTICSSTPRTTNVPNQVPLFVPATMTTQFPATLYTSTFRPPVCTAVAVTTTSVPPIAHRSSVVSTAPYIRVLPAAAIQNIPANGYPNPPQQLLQVNRYMPPRPSGSKVMIMNNGVVPTAFTRSGIHATVSSSTPPSRPVPHCRKRKVRTYTTHSPPIFTYRGSSTLSDSSSSSPLFSYQLNSTTGTTVGLQVKDDTAVDPQCQAQNMRVYRDTYGNVYSAVLARTDWESETNVFHKLQILQSSSGRDFRFFQSKGEIGGAGYMRSEKVVSDAGTAVSEFDQVFFELTGNAWRERSAFHQIHHKMILLDIIYKPNVIVDDSAAPSLLVGPVQKFIRQIHQFGTTSRELESIAIQTLDLEKWPLGRISGTQIQEAYQILLRLEDCVSKVERTDDDLRTIIRRTNEYYSLIPRHFDTGKPLLLNTMARIQKETEKLDSLMMTETKYSLIDAYYEKLNATLRPLGPEEVMYEVVKSCLLNTCSNKNMTIVEIFKVERIGEDARFTPFKTLPNRKLLWHGSKLVNFSRILAQGLCIAPEGAQISGHCFGRGIYFSDMVEKSIHYCDAHAHDGAKSTSLLLLCEVALGNMQCVTRNDSSIFRPQDGFNSVKAVGKTAPDPQLNMVLEDGIEIGVGPGVVQQATSHIAFNEYIVFNEAQVKIRYLAQVAR